MHRDIKPENIMLRRDGYAKVLDFGLVKLTERSLTMSDGLPDDSPKVTMGTDTDPGMIMGTAHYMSPEQAQGQDIDGRADIWSLGVVLYEMLTGRVPFEGATPHHVIISIIEKEPPPIINFAPAAPAELERIITRALCKNKDDRYPFIKEMGHDLKRLKQRLEFEAELERSLTPAELLERREEAAARFNAGQSAQTIIEPFPRRSSEPHPNNLSTELSPLIGREQEVSAISNLLRQEEVRLLTLSGIGGTGKTRLAQAVARQMLSEFTDGAFFIELSPISDPALVVSEIAQPLGLKEAGGTPLKSLLKTFLHERAVLLAIDNFEHVTAAAPLVAELLAAAPRLKVLVTSRALLHLSLEHEFSVPPLALPSPETFPAADELMRYAAITLFVERARAARHGFILTDENARAVAEVCARLDGLPLAIELAAARVKLLTPQAILSRLENRLKLLTGGAKDLPARQQTMRGAISWSYDLLEEDERKLMQRLAVFNGEFYLEAAEAVCAGGEELSSPEYGSQAKAQSAHKAQSADAASTSLYPPPTPIMDVLDGVASLVDKSLLVQKEQDDREPRFRMLAVVREYATERLAESGEMDAIRSQHAHFFLALAETAEPELVGAHQAEWLGRLEAEHDNLRSALEWT
ncbi:MAG TPA: protein kinase, partial [Pyrinomonadaceae bacterium]